MGKTTRKCASGPIEPPKPVFRLARVSAALVGLGFLSISPAFAATVIGVSPENATHSASINTNVTVNLSSAEESGLSAQTIVIHNSQTARTGANTPLGHGTTTIGNNPFNDFHLGELVHVTITSGIETTGMVSLENYVWQFRVKPTGGSGIFFQSSNSFAIQPGVDVALGDLDGDEDLDAFVVNISDTGSPNRVWINDGSGLFTDSGSSLGNDNSYAVALGDLDGDGDFDAFVGIHSGAGDRVWMNDGSGSFSQSINQLVGGQTFGVALGDMDGDGDLDAISAIANTSGNRFWLNNGSGIFADSGSILGTFGRDVEVGDVDSDGDLDVWFARSGSGGHTSNQVWLNDGDGSFTDSCNSLGNSFSTDVALGDLDNDKDLDAFVPNSNPLASVRP